MESNRKVQYLAAFSVSLAFLAVGACSAWPTPVLLKFHNNETSVVISNTEISWMLGLNPIGFLIGSFTARFIIDKFGRRYTLLASMVPVVVGTVIAVSVTRGWMLMMTQFLWSFGTAILCTVQGIYFAEIADKDIRGTLSLSTRYMFNLGNLLVIGAGPFITYQTLNLYLLFIPLTFLIASFWIPETPYYYLKEDKVNEARKVLMQLRGIKDEKELDSQLALIEMNVKEDMTKSSSVKQLFSGAKYRKAIVIVSGLKITSIFTGTVTIRQYFGRILQEGRIPKEMEGTVFIVFGAVGFLTAIVASVLVDRLGRRPLLIGSYIVTGVCLAAIGIYFFLQDAVLVDSAAMSPYGYLPFIGILLVTISSTIGFNSIVNFMPAELFPLNVKAIAMSLNGILSGVLGFAIAKSYQDIKDLCGIYTVFWIFAVFSCAGGVFCYYLVPETKGKGLAEIQEMLQSPWLELRTYDGTAKFNIGDNKDSEEERASLTEVTKI